VLSRENGQVDAGPGVVVGFGESRFLMAKKKTSKRKYDETIEGAMCSAMMHEYETCKQNQRVDFDDFESYLALLDAERTEKDYDWMSDIHIPEFLSHMLTQLSMDVDTYYQSRDFVECYLQDESIEALRASDATKELINRTLNQRSLFHYLKFVRARLLNRLDGKVYAECLWNQQSRKAITGYEEVYQELDVDVDGNPIEDPETQEAKIELVKRPVYGEKVFIDQFEYEILDPRNVFTDNSYVCSLQQKPYVIIRSEKTLSQLKRDKDRAGYFNLDLLEEVGTGEETETARETYNKDENKEYAPPKGEKKFDILKRYGEDWCLVDEMDDMVGLPSKVSPGVDEDGEPLEKAELHHVIKEIAMSDGSSGTLIAFHVTPYLDASDIPYIPVIRGLCYPHPVNDGGFGDAKHVKDLQIAIDDTFNLCQDGTMLATIPLFQGKELSIEDNDSLFVEPGHIMSVKEIGDLQQFPIRTDIGGSMNQLSMLFSKMQQFDATFPTTMGDVPSRASTTATAVAGAEGRSNQRSNFKALTFEHTFDDQLYWMIQQMTWRFAKPETGYKLMGQKVLHFDPTRDYWFKPLSQALEGEQSKQAKIRNLLQFIQALSPYSQLYANDPQFKVFMNYLFERSATYMGDEVVNVSRKLLNPNVMPRLQAPGGNGQQGGGPALPGASFEAPTGNQNGMPQSDTEVMARANAGGGM